MTSKIENLLERSAFLERALNEFWNSELWSNEDRFEVSAIMCDIAHEHGKSVRTLMGVGAFTSALGLFRLQYEALVKANWLFFAAGNMVLQNLVADLTLENANKADKLPNMPEMLSALKGKAPEAAVGMLMEFKEQSWKHLSSYVHGGMHAFNRNRKGYPVSILCDLIKQSNALAAMTTMHLIMLSGNSKQAGKMPKIQFDFADCLPELKKIV